MNTVERLNKTKVVTGYGRRFIIVKKLSYTFSNFFKLNHNDFAVAVVNKIDAVITVRKKLFIPRVKKKFKIKPTVKSGLIQGFDVSGPYWAVCQFLKIINYTPVIDEEHVVTNCVGYECGFVYKSEWENPNIFNSKGDKLSWKKQLLKK